MTRTVSARRDGPLGQPTHTIHPIREMETVPVDNRRGGKLVGNIDPHAITFDDLDRRTVDLPIVAPSNAP